MKLNLSNPLLGLQKLVDIDDEKKLLFLMGKRISMEVTMDSIGDEFRGYVFRITGGNDKQGFPMMQGILVNHRVRLLLRKGMSGYRCRRKGEMKRKSVRGAIVSSDLAVLSLKMVKKGEEDIPGLTVGQLPRRLGPKRASNIRKMFGLTRKDDVTKYVVRREISEKKKFKSPRIQRLVTPRRLERKRHIRKTQREAARKTQEKRAVYKGVLGGYFKSIHGKK